MTTQSLPISLLLLARPRQWVKNALLFAPLVFARELFELPLLFLSVMAFLGYCLAASTVYVFNDIADVEADRLHPEKKNRPIASGRVSLSQARVFGLALFLGTATIASQLPYRYGATVFLYLALNIAYSVKLKHVVLLDVFTISSGFMLRVLAGAFAIGVQASTWLVLCSLFVSLFLGFAKRRGELLHTSSDSQESGRRVLGAYKLGFLDQMLTISAAGTVISYALYTVSPRTIQIFETERLIYTTVFVCYGVFRYLYLIHTDPRTENPTNTLTSDIPILINGVLWLCACIFIIYTAGRFH